ncbi:MAG: class I SAM-dependent methyltransferase [Gammaproteobacteria bacterium]|jgi:predicted TPR repeat methyltransferase|nr:class I SAM-dependent methyltransferase [Gammaproteobacteria bacterium]
MIDQQTLNVYNAKADAYANLPATDIDEALQRFANQLIPPAVVLDLGCGHGANAAYLRDLGHQVQAWDASTSMQQVAKQRFNVDVQLKTFDQLEGEQQYHGICANYSLLHVPPDQLPGYLAAIAKALMPGGLLHLGMKLGTGTERDHLGRFYAYYSEPQLSNWLTNLGLRIEWRQQSVAAGLAGKPETGMVLHARKAGQ